MKIVIFLAEKGIQLILKPPQQRLALCNKNKSMATPRKTRSDKKVGTIEKELGIQLYGANGRKIRRDKTLGEVRKQQGVKLTDDQKLAAKIEIKIPPKANLTRVNKVSKVVEELNQNGRTGRVSG